MGKYVLYIVFFLCGLGVGSYLLTEKESVDGETALEHAVKHADPEYVCPMHPQITDTKQSSCPICGMDLELRAQDETVADGDKVQVSAAMRNSLGIRVVHVDRGQVAEEIYASGFVERVSDSQSVEIVTRVDAEDITIHVKQGQWLEKGDTVATIRNSEFTEKYKKYLHLMETSKVLEALVLRKELVEMGISEFAVAGTVTDRKLSDDLEIDAPFAGEVMFIADLSGSVPAGQRLVKIGSPSLAEAELRSYSRVARGVKKGNKGYLEVAHRPGKSWEGQVTDVIHNRSGFYTTVTFHVEVPPGMMEAGVFAGAFIESGNKSSVIRVPSSALIYDEGVSRVVRLREDDTFEVVEVITGFEGHEWVEITAGLDEGDHVVIRGQFLIDSEATLRAGLKRFEE